MDVLSPAEDAWLRTAPDGRGRMVYTDPATSQRYRVEWQLGPSMPAAPRPLSEWEREQLSRLR